MYLGTSDENRTHFQHLAESQARADFKRMLKIQNK